MQRCSLDHGYSSPIAPCLLKKAICFLLAALSSFLERRPQAETCSSLTPSTTCVPNPDTIGGSKALFPLWGKLSKEEHRDPFPKAGRSLEGLSRVKNHQAQIHKKVKKYRTADICLSAPIQVALLGRGRTDYPTNRGCWCRHGRR